MYGLERLAGNRLLIQPAPQSIGFAAKRSVALAFSPSRKTKYVSFFAAALNVFFQKNRVNAKVKSVLRIKYLILEFIFTFAH